MSSRSGKKPVVAAVDPAKLERIRQGKKTVNVTGVKENKKNISNKDGSKFLAIEKEKKFEEAGVKRKKRNFVMYESKLGTEKDRDLLKLQGAKKNKPRPKPQNIEETIISKYKRKEYLDNFQYHETKELRKKNPSKVVHTRMSDPITGSTIEYSSYTHISSNSGRTRGANRGGQTSTTTRTTRTETKRTNSSGNLRNRPNPRLTSASATKSIESTTRVGRRGGAGGAQKTTTTTRTEKKTTRTTRTRK